MVQPRILLLTLPAQGHINPSLQLAKLLIRAGAHVTFFTSSTAGIRMPKPPAMAGLDFLTFFDGYEHGFNLRDHDLQQYVSELERLGSAALTELITARADEGRPFACLLYGILLPWAAEVAGAHHLPSVLVWSQPATVFDIYYYYFNGEKNLTGEKNLPGLPSLSACDLPSFLVQSEASPHDFILRLYQRKIEQLNQEGNPRVLVNSFDALEPEALTAIDKVRLMGIGPLLPSAFLDGKYPSDTSFGGDFFRESKEDYIQWLNSKGESSVIYVSFGSVSVLSKRQSEELARGLLDSGRPFLWVIRVKREEDEWLTSSCVEELEKQGMIVGWCSQVRVLSHPAVGCFVTHCGWNSTLESLACGVPMVGFPQWVEQSTNAKLVEDVWRSGVRAVAGGADGSGIAEGGEIKKCLELVMGDGERGRETRRNAKKWKDLGREAMREGGSSHKNLKNFMDEIIIN